MSAPSTVTLAADINREHEAAFGKAREAVEHARRCGELLLEAKAAVGHGAWLPWLEANVHFSARQAQRYMTVAENWTAIASKCDTESYLTLRGALAAIAEPQAPRAIDPLAALWARRAEEQAEIKGILDSLNAGEIPPNSQRLGDLMSDEHWEAFTDEWALLVRADLARNGLQLTRKLTPIHGQCVVGRLGELMLHVVPWDGGDFYFVSVVANFESADAVVYGTLKPVARSALHETVRGAGFEFKDPHAVLMRQSSEPWSRNMYLEGAAAC